jgi:hypothetical protein
MAAYYIDRHTVTGNAIIECLENEASGCQSISVQSILERENLIMERIAKNDCFVSSSWLMCIEDFLEYYSFLCGLSEDKKDLIVKASLKDLNHYFRAGFSLHIAQAFHVA